MDNRMLLVFVWSICQLWMPASTLLTPTDYSDLTSDCYGGGTSTEAGIGFSALSGRTLELDDNEAHTYMAENFQYMFDCCGLVTQWHFNAAITGTLQVQVWRRTTSTSYELIGENYCEVTSTGWQNPPCNVDRYDQISVRKGDFMGWHNQGKDMIRYYRSSTHAFSSSDLENMFHRQNIGDKYKGDVVDWSSVEAYNDRLYAIQATYGITNSHSPTFTVTSSINVPDYISNGDTITRISYGDLDYNDNSSLVVVKTSTSVYYDTDIPSGYVSATNSYRPQSGVGNKLEYFMYDLCYNTASTTVTLTVVDSNIKIDNLDADLTVSVNDKTQRLLHTITVYEPTDETWCWEVSGFTHTPETPFMLLATTTTSTNVEYGFYLTENGNFDKSSYDFVVKCSENKVSGTAATATGTLTVHVTGHQKPVFTNLDAAVTVDSETSYIGDIVYNVTASDPEGSIVTFTGLDCKTGGATDSTTFTILKNGQVLLKKFLALSTYYQFDCVVTMQDESPVTSGAFPAYTVTGNLHISIININNQVTITNMPPSTIQIQENMAVGTSVWKFEYTDLDAGTLDKKTWSMSIDDAKASRYFYLDPDTGLLSLAFSEIDVKDTGLTTYTLSITVGDVKTTTTQPFQISIINENEPPWFTKDYYTIDTDEGPDDGKYLNLTGESIVFTIKDEDLDENITGEVHSYSLDCDNVTNTQRFYINPSNGRIKFQGDYDLDVAGTPSDIACTITVQDKYGLSDTANVYIHINNVNEYAPEFTRSNYTFYLATNTLVGTYLATLSAVDLDSSDDDDNVITYTLNHASSGATDILTINNNGAVYVIDTLEAYAGMGTIGPIEALASNYNHRIPKTGTTLIFIEIPGTTTVTTTTTDRNKDFYENQWSYYWLLGTLFGVTLIIVAVSLACFRICRLSRIGPYCYACCMKGICCRPAPPPLRGFGDRGYDLASFGHRHRYVDEDEEVDGWLRKKKSKNEDSTARYGRDNIGFDSTGDIRKEPIYEMFRVPPKVPKPASYLEKHAGTRKPPGGERWKDRKPLMDR